MGTWAVYIPSVERELGISHAVLGLLLLLIGLGAIIAMQIAGRLADRFSPGAVATVSLLLLCLSTLGPAFAPNLASLAVSLLLLGMFEGATDVAMNAHGVQVESGYRRPIFSAFHALWSIGGVAATLLGSVMISAGIGRGPGMAAIAAAVAGVTLALAGWPLRRAAIGPDGHVGDPIAEGPAAVANSGETAREEYRPGVMYFVALGVLTAFAFMAEGCVGDWGPLFSRDILHAPESQAAFCFGAFSAAMTLGRLTVDRVVARRGSLFVVRWGSLLAIASLTEALLAPNLWMSLLGWFGLGLGLSGLVPQLFLAASRAGGNPATAGRDFAKVVGIAYAGMLIGPTLIGLLATVMPLNLALLSMTPLLFAIWFSSPYIRGLQNRASEASTLER